LKPGTLFKYNQNCKSGETKRREPNRDIVTWREVKIVPLAVIGAEYSYMGMYKTTYMYNGDFTIQRAIISPGYRCSCWSFQRRPSMSAYVNVERYYFIRGDEEYGEIKISFTGQKYRCTNSGVSIGGVLNVISIAITFL
jgi:hypothetical protein